MAKELPVVSVVDEKVLKDTGSAGRPFWSKIGTTRWIRFFGILIYKHRTSGNFPDPEDKK